MIGLFFFFAFSQYLAQSFTEPCLTYHINPNKCPCSNKMPPSPPPCLFFQSNVLLTCMISCLLLWFGSSLKWGLLLKERICSQRSKFFPLRVDPSQRSKFFPLRVDPSQRSKFFPLRVDPSLQRGIKIIKMLTLKIYPSPLYCY